MPRANLTAAAVDRLKSPKSGQLEYYDQRFPSFGVRISYQGTKSWFVMTRLSGKLIRVTLGRYPVVTLAEARRKARDATDLTAAGFDPRRLREDAEEKQRNEQRNTYSACVAEFLEKHGQRRLRPSTQREYRRILTGEDTRSWKSRPMSQITKRDVLEVIDKIDQRGSPGAAKRVLVYLRKFFNWCAEREIIATAPTDRIRPPHPEISRDRVLSVEELRYLLKALDSEVGIFGQVIRLLLLTGQRRAEVAGMRWSELRDLDEDSPIWAIPGERTKNKQAHLVPLVLQVLDVIHRVPKTDDLLFTTTGNTPVSGFGKAKNRLNASINDLRAADGLEPMSPWTIHDLRRTMVTMMNERLGVAPHIVEAAVNHMSGLAKAGVAGVYNRALYLGERRIALTRWADYLGDISSGS